MNKGFTLLEVMVSLLILGIIVLLIFSGLQLLIRNEKNLQKRIDTFQEIELGMIIIKRDMEHASLPKPPKPPIEVNSHTISFETYNSSSKTQEMIRYDLKKGELIRSNLSKGIRTTLFGEIISAQFMIRDEATCQNAVPCLHAIDLQFKFKQFGLIDRLFVLPYRFNLMNRT